MVIVGISNDVNKKITLSRAWELREGATEWRETDVSLPVTSPVSWRVGDPVNGGWNRDDPGHRRGGEKSERRRAASVQQSGCDGSGRGAASRGIGRQCAQMCPRGKEQTAIRNALPLVGRRRSGPDRDRAYAFSIGYGLRISSLRAEISRPWNEQILKNYSCLDLFVKLHELSLTLSLSNGSVGLGNNQYYSLN